MFLRRSFGPSISQALQRHEQEEGERWKEAHMLCTMAGVCLEFQQVEQAEHHARSAVRLANGLGDRTEGRGS
eukprot:s509_g20.t1